MISNSEQRIGVFVDLSNLYHTARRIHGARPNFGNILEAAVNGRKLIRAFAYGITSPTSEEEKFLESLTKVGFELRMKDLQVFADGTKKGDWDVGITVDALRYAKKLDVAVLVTGDGDFVPLAQALQHEGVRVEGIAFGESSSAKLKEAVDHFTDLSKDKMKFLIPSRLAQLSRTRITRH
ncbi:MAG: hypothetical protein COT26_02690 [Candidatus Kerfeldbacteria bacterium CG08_land_8_20_14_0_20_43_14]|uniref:NYN domain-containing protein n=1 Tax=Candidatus Kerfeldbacteria bacterium CG08_land_8_20_14_0_20_43_14 TaxID=2014246 RepID=A0A2H0YS32_9BACT|nr:MAG: hypothetical protein COT26_02690 [Candidatus Kerfeldbacteria bacterium CG08_land_8_20_14_0_20_43_14]